PGACASPTADSPARGNATSAAARRTCRSRGRCARSSCPWLRHRSLRLRNLRPRSIVVKMASRRLPAAERRAQLVDVGRSVFARRGYEAASVEEIAARAKVSKPIVYEHFGGKEGLYAVVVDREIEQIVRRIVDAMSSGSPRERLERAALA